MIRGVVKLNDTKNLIFLGESFDVRSFVKLRDTIINIPGSDLEGVGHRPRQPTEKEEPQLHMLTAFGFFTAK